MLQLPRRQQRTLGPVSRHPWATGLVVVVLAASLGWAVWPADPHGGSVVIAFPPAELQPAEPPAPVPSRPPPVSPALADLPSERREQLAARRPKTILELQPWRRETVATITDGSGRTGTAVLTQLQPRINAWHLLEIAWSDARREAHHLELRDPATARLVLDAETPSGLVIIEAESAVSCALWQGRPSPLEQLRDVRQVRVPLCGGRLFRLQALAGRKTQLERTTDFLRDHVWGGEQLTVLVRQTLYQDAFLETSELAAGGEAGRRRQRPAGAPPRPALAEGYSDQALRPSGLGLELVDPLADGKVLAGRWYAVRDQPSLYLSAVQAAGVDAGVRRRESPRLNALDEVESTALAYLVAFDLDAFELHFTLGTDHPRLGWSERAPATVVDPGLPGPDGIVDAAPLVRAGQVSPAHTRRLAAAFTGGFKRSHGAFKSGWRSLSEDAHHYGFVEQGTILSRLRPSLATVAVWDDGAVELGTWSADDEARLGRLRHARQNGLPLVETDPASGEPRVGEMVRRWGEGNWSGSADQRLRTLRAGLCELVDGERRYLVYGYFSSATPSAMALVFVAYGCRYALLTDMNALEHTYLALYRYGGAGGGALDVQHLIDGMRVLDRENEGRVEPRFVAFPDNRDFFYLTRNESEP